KKMVARRPVNAGAQGRREQRKHSVSLFGRRERYFRPITGGDIQRIPPRIIEMARQEPARLFKFKSGDTYVTIGSEAPTEGSALLIHTTRRKPEDAEKYAQV
ncbi:MAG: hypothetical protein NTW59_04685, partial [Candidatus Diapherotrites archaeon]|nr:hypothetical protein [Candidatus Diapherotrites archaeon]